MSTTLMTSESHMLTSESVTEGHPDKLCDQISDGVLDAVMANDPQGRVACETSTTTGLVLVAGEISTDTYVDIPSIAREVIREAGYTRAKYGFDCDTCGIIVSIKEQSKDIAQGVNPGGAGDQGMMIGFACNETPELMPMTISLAHKLCKRMADTRKDGTLPYLRPDGKSQVTVEYSGGVPVRVDTVVLAAQHDPSVSQETIQKDLIEHVVNAVIPKNMLDERTKYHINATGRFEIGGPMGDAGLTGRKIIVDTYGGVARHGGGAFSGKDPTKVDRSASYAARYVAKNVVAAGLADRIEVQLSYAIGVAEPTSVAVETFGMGRVPDDLILECIKKNFDLTPAGIIDTLDLRRPIYRPTAAYGHFGRSDLDLPWERTDKVEALKAAAGIQDRPGTHVQAG